MELNSRGTGTLTVRLTPDHMTQRDIKSNSKSISPICLMSSSR